MSVFAQRVCLDFGEFRVRCCLPTDDTVFDSTHHDLLAKHPILLSRRGKRQAVSSMAQMYTAGTITDRIALEQYLRTVLSQAGISLFPFGAHTCIFALPSGTTPVNKSTWSTILRSLGFSEVIFSSTLLSAAVGVGFSLPLTRSICVVHVGHGVSQVGLLTLYGVVYHKNISLSGTHLTQLVYERVRATVGTSLREAQLESVLTQAELKDRKRYGKGATPEWKRIAYEEIETQMDIASNEILLAIEEMGSSFLASITEHGILLTGGLSRLPGLAERISSRIHMPVFALPESDAAVINGLPKLLLGMLEKKTQN